MSAPAWIPIESPSLGKLPEYHGVTVTYPLEDVVPAVAKAVLVYIFVTSTTEGDHFQRGYYEISTASPKVDEPDFKQYMNVATGPNVTIVNSINLWFPLMVGKELKIKLYHPESEERKKKSIAGKRADEQWSDVFVLGYRC